MTKDTKERIEPDLVNDPVFPPIGDEAAPDDGSDAQEFLPGYKTRADAEKALKDRDDEREQHKQEIAAARTREQSFQQVLDGLGSRGTAPAAAPAPEPGLDFSKLPDPVEDREGFMRGLQDQVTGMVTSHDKQHTQQRSHEQRLSDMWGQFQTDYPELNEFPEIVEAAVRAEVNRGAARGLTPQQVMFDSSDRLMQRVAETSQKRIGVLKTRFTSTDDADEAGESGTRRTADRTAGVSNGTSAAGKGKSSGADDPSKYGSMIGDMKKLQRDSGFV